MFEYDRNYLRVPLRIVELLRDDPTTFMVFVALLSRAAWRPTTVATKHGPIALERGQAVFGRTELSRICAASERAVRTSLARLKTIQAVQLDTSNHGTVITLLGYDTCGDRDPALIQHPASSNGIQRPANDQHPASGVTTNVDLRSKKVDLTPEHARARDPSTPVPTPVRSPDLNSERTRLHGLAIKRLNEARLDIGGRLGLSLRPLHPFDHKLQEAVLFLLADEIIERFEADLEHVLQIRIAEALADKRKARWLSASLFEWGAWRVALSMTLADTQPADREPRELAYAPVRPEDDPPDFTYGAIGDPT